MKGEGGAIALPNHQKTKKHCYCVLGDTAHRLTVFTEGGGVTCRQGKAVRQEGGAIASSNHPMAELETPARPSTTTTKLHDHDHAGSTPAGP